MNSRMVFWFSCVLLLAACTKDEPTHWLESAKGHIAQGDVNAATVELKTALQLNADLPEARYLLGQAYLKLGDIAAAEKEFIRARELGHSMAEINPPLARIGVEKGDFQQVVREYSGADTATPRGSAELHTSLGEAHFSLGELDAAAREFNQAVAADPTYSAAYLANARLAERRGDMQQALRQADQGIQVAPTEPEGWLVKGWLLADARRPDDAIEAYRKALAVKTDFAPARAALIAVLIDAGKLEDASGELAQLKAIAPKAAKTLYLEAMLNLQQNNLTAARDAILEYQRIAPDDPSAAMLAANVHFRLHAYSQAESNLLKVLRQAPGHDLARRMLVGTYVATGDIPHALETLQPLLNKIGGDPAMLNVAGEIFLRSGQPTVAATYFAQAKLIDPTGATQRTGLALSHLAQGEVSVATKELEAVASKYSESRADVALITLALSQRDYAKALAATDALEKKDPGKPVAPDLRGLILLAKNDRAAARQAFEQAVTRDPAFVPAVLNLVRLDYAENKPLDGQRRLEAFVSVHPTNPKALLALAELRIRANAPQDEVVALLTRAIDAEPNEPEARVALINYYLARGEAKRGLVAALEGAGPLRERPEMIEALARAQVAADETNQAIMTYTRLTRSLPNSTSTLLKLAELQRLAHDYDGAAASLERAVRIDPRLIDAQRPLVGVYVAAKRWKDALEIAQRVQKQRPKEAVGYLLEGDVYAAQGTWPAAVEAYRVALKQSGASFAAVKLHTGLLASGRTAEANKVMDSWLHDHPNDASFRLYLAENAIDRGDAATAAEQYRALLRNEPDNPMLLNNLAWAAAKLKDPEALSYAEKANRLAPDQPKILDTLGVLLAEQGNTARAVQTLQRAVQLAPTDPALRLNLARVLVQAGDRSDARRELEELAKLGNRFSKQAEVGELMKTL